MKSSFLTGEGWNTISVVLGGLWILHGHLSGGGTQLPVDQMLALAGSAQEIADIYKAAKEQAVTGGLSDLGQSGVILAFVYAVLRKFIESRTDLKKAMLESQK